MHRTGNQQHRKSHLVRWTARLSYADVAATLALFFALTGTAAAAVTLGRDSVGAEHIQADAVGSSEIQADAVRSQEIRDESIELADLTPGARTSLDAPRIRVDQRQPLAVRVDMLELAGLHEPARDPRPRRALARSSKLTVIGDFAPLGNKCGLVQSDTTVVDAAENIGGPAGLPDRRAGRADRRRDHRARRVHHRCTAMRRIRDYDVYWRSGMLTAIEVKDETQTD